VIRTAHVCGGIKSLSLPASGGLISACQFEKV
jgi:hypothetical protein